MDEPENNQQKRRREVKEQIKRHAQNAYALFPKEAASMGHMTAALVRQAAEQGRWQQVAYRISSLSRANQFSDKLLFELSLSMAASKTFTKLVAQELVRHISADGKKVMGECVRALAFGSFIGHINQFEIISGFKYERVKGIAQKWAELEDNVLALAVAREAMGHIIGFSHGKESEWMDYISVPWEKVSEFYNEWQALEKEIIDEPC